jgi:hypothetical protein
VPGRQIRSCYPSGTDQTRRICLPLASRPEQQGPALVIGAGARAGRGVPALWHLRCPSGTQCNLGVGGSGPTAPVLTGRP